MNGYTSTPEHFPSFNFGMEDMSDEDVDRKSSVSDIVEDRVGIQKCSKTRLGKVYKTI